MALKKPGPGRPSKGARHQLATRVPIEHAREIEQRADALGISMSEYLADVIATHVSTTSPPASVSALIAREEVAV